MDPNNPRSLKHLRLMRWLNLGGAAIAMAMVLLLGFEYTNVQDLGVRDAEYSEGVTNSVFQLEREFLLLRASIDRELVSRNPIDWDRLQLRSDLFQSRIDVIRNNLGSQSLHATRVYENLNPRLGNLSQLLDSTFNGNHPNRSQLVDLLQQMDAMVLDVNGLSSAASAEVNHMQEAARMALNHQHRVILLVVLMQLLLLAGAAALLVVRVRKEVLERETLRKLAREMSEANARSEMAMRGKNQFLANMSHELRTPLNGMLGMLGLLEGTRVDPAQADYIQTARDSARHLLVLLNDILDISSLDEGKMTLKPDVVRLGGVLADVEALVRPMTHAKGLGLAVALDGNLPLWVQIDETRVKQILLNLLSNAVKFSDSGTIRLSVHGEGISQPKQGELATVWMEVSDQGIGMDADTCSRLFQRFEQGDASSTRRFGGTGLGLEISRNLSRLMQGDITVSSTPGRGSTFSVCLKMPCVEPPAPHLAAPALTPQPGSGAQVLDIVVAEDNSTNRKFMAALLDKLGHKARFAEDGEQAVAMVNRSVPDLVLMDMHMPVMDGIVATRTLRASPGLAAKVPIIALSADVMKDMQERAREAGINGFLAKPLDVQLLEATLSQLFPNAGRARPAAQGGEAVAGSGKGASPVPDPAPIPSPSHAPSKNARPLRPGEMVAHLNLNVVGEVCLIVGREGYQEMLQEFALSPGGNLMRLLGVLQDSGTPATREMAHSVKGEAATLGLVTLSAAAAKVEHGLADFTPEQRVDAAQQLIAAWDLAATLLQRLGLVQSEALQAQESVPAAPVARSSARAPDGTPRRRDLVQLIYSSTMVDRNALELEEIHRVSLRNNTRDAITGMLLFSGDQVLQVLEGERRDVERTYARIQADGRHRDLLLISQLPVPERQFADWSTGMCRGHPGGLGGTSAPYFGARQMDLKTLVSPGSTLDMMQAFASSEMGIY